MFPNFGREGENYGLFPQFGTFLVWKAPLSAPILPISYTVKDKVENVISRLGEHSKKNLTNCGKSP